MNEMADELATTSVTASSNSKQPESTQGFDLGSIINDQAKAIPQGPAATPIKKRRSFLKVALFLIIIGGFVFGAYFAASIFYPVELENITNTISQMTKGLTASAPGGPVTDDNTDTDVDNTPIEIIDDQIATPIADSIERSLKIEGQSNDGTITSNEQIQDNWDTVLPQTTGETNTGNVDTGSIDSNENTILPDTSISVNTGIPTDPSLDDLKDAFSLSDAALQSYIDMLLDIKDKVDIRTQDYAIENDQRGITITTTINKRVDELIEELEKAKDTDEETTITKTIEKDIAQLNQLLEALDK